MAEEVERGKGGGGNWLGITWNLLLILFLLLLILIVGGVGAGTYIFKEDVLDRIEALRYDDYTQRLERYRSFFNSLQEEGHQVVSYPDYQISGKRQITWTVRYRGEQDSVSYVWEYDLETEQFIAKTRAAWELDQELDLESEKGFGDN